MFDKLKRKLNREYNIFCTNVETIDNWITVKCPRGSHSEWDRMPVIECSGIRENHSYNNFIMYDMGNKFKIVFELEMKTGIDKYCEDIRKEQHKKMMSYDFRDPKEIKLFPKKPYVEPTFEEQRYFMVDPKDLTKFKAVNRHKFFKLIKDENLVDYFNFKMEELFLNHV